MATKDVMTPMALCVWLRKMPEINWPTDYQALCQLGVERWVVEWLEIAIAAHYGKVLTEETVVRTFLFVMARRDTFDHLPLTQAAQVRGNGFVQVVKGIFSTVHGGSETGVEMQLADEIAAALQGMTADLWPDQVYELAVV